MHSGTTLLYKALGQSSLLFTSKGESKYFEFLPRIRDRFADLGDLETRRALVGFTLENLLDGFQLAQLHGAHVSGSDHALLGAALDAVGDCRDHGDVFYRVFDFLTLRAGRGRWMEKTPSHVFQIEVILRSIPTARFVEITRDPRDILASKKTRRETVWSTDRYGDEERAYKHLEKAYDPLWDALSWKSAVTAGRAARAKHPDRMLRISYEHLVADPESVLRQICDFLEMPFEPAMLAATGGNSAEWNGAPAKDGIYTSSVGRWQQTLTSPELALCQAVVQRELDELAYDREPVRLLDRARASGLALRSTAHLFVRLHRRWRMGGTSFLRSVVRDYGKRLAILIGER